MAGELSPALLTRMLRFARHHWQSCASSPRLRCDARTLHRLRAPTNRSLHGPLLHRTRPRRRRREKPPRQTEKTDLALCAPLYLSWFIAPPSFQLLREASRRWAFFCLNRGHLFSFSRASFLPSSCSFPTFYRVHRSFSLDECQASGSHR